jgi:iron complex transport system substrate-binding protein
VRIVSLLPSASEILGALGLLEQIVAVSHECDHPAEVTAKPRITSSSIPSGLDPKQINAAVNEAVQQGRALYAIDGDLLARLHPDLIVTQGICDVCAVGAGTVAATLKFLPDCLPPGAQTVTLSGTTFAGILRDIRQVARSAGVEARGEALVAELQERWQMVQTAPKTARPRVLVLEWGDPPFSAGHWVPEMVAVAGGEDVLGKAGAVSHRVSWARILETDPDLVVMAACGYGLAQNAGFAEGLYAHPEASRLRAFRTGQVYAVDANAYFSRLGPRVVRGAELLHALFSGQASCPSELVVVAEVPD